MKLQKCGSQDREAVEKLTSSANATTSWLWEHYEGWNWWKTPWALWSRRTVFIDCGCCQLFSWLNGMQRDLCTEMPTFGSVPCHALPFQLCRLLGACCRSKGPQVDFRLSVEPLLPKTVAQPCRCSLWKVRNVSVSNLLYVARRVFWILVLTRVAENNFIRFHTLVPRTLFSDILTSISVPLWSHSCSFRSAQLRSRKLHDQYAASHNAFFF